MIARYGHRWTSQFGDRPIGAAAAEWAETLAGTNSDALAHGFAVDAERGDDWPPSSAKFRALCQPPESDALRTYFGSPPVKRDLTAIESDRSKAAAKRELGALCKKLGIDIDLDAAP